MSAFLRTLFGDTRTMSLTVIVVGIEQLLVSIGEVHSAAYLVPVLVIGGVAWLATQ